jgi:hypothetical protein
MLCLKHIAVAEKEEEKNVCEASGSCSVAPIKIKEQRPTKLNAILSA